MTDPFRRIVQALARFGNPDLPADMLRAARALADSEFATDPEFEVLLGQLESPDATPTAEEATEELRCNAAFAPVAERSECTAEPAATPVPSPQEPQPDRPPQPEPATAEPARSRPAGKAVFRPPTVAEVAAYCAERGNRVDAEQFVAFYAAKGWVTGRKPMKDWQGAVRTWERSDGQGPQRPSARKRPALRPPETPYLPRQSAAARRPPARSETTPEAADLEAVRRAVAASLDGVSPPPAPVPTEAPVHGPGPDGVWRDGRGVRLAFESEDFARAWALRVDQPGLPLAAWDRAKLALQIVDNRLTEKQAVEALALLEIDPGRVGPLRHPDVEIQPLARGDAAANEKAVREWLEAE